MAPSFVQRYWIALKKYKWVAAAVMLVTPVGALVIGLQQPSVSKEYQVKGVLVSNAPPGVFSETGTQIQEAGKILSREILLADNVVEATAQTVNLDPKTLIKGLQVDVQLPDEEHSYQVTVVHQSRNEKLSEQVVETLLNAMLEQSRLVNTARLRTRIEAIQARLPQVIADLRAAEQRLEAYNRREEADILAARGGSLVGAIAGSQEQQRQLRLTLQGVEAQIQSLEQRLGMSVDQAYVSSALSADPLIASLRAQIHQAETQLEVLGRDLRPEHPTIVQLQSQKEALEKLLADRAKEVIGGNNQAAPLLSNLQSLQVRQDSALDPTRQQLANTLVSLQTQKETLEQQLVAAQQSEQQLRQEYATIPNKQLEQNRLAQEVVLKKSLHDRIQAALVDAQAAEAETVTSLQIAQPALLDKTMITAPLSKWVIGGAGIGAGLLVAGSLVFLLSLLEGRFYTKEELEAALRQEAAPVLGIIPWIELKGWDGNQPDESLPVFPLILERQSPYLQNYEQVRSNLGRIGERGAKVVLISSPSTGEGKTLTAYNLAIAGARAGKRTILIEADLRHPTQSQQVGINPHPHRLGEPLRYYSSPSHCIHPAPRVENLYVIPSVGPQLQPVAILESSEIRRLIKDCRGRFDLVILDSPALNLYSDALLIEPLVDGVMLVVRPGETQNRSLKEVLNQVEIAEVPLLGVVINGARVASEAKQTSTLTEEEEIFILPQAQFTNGHPKPSVRGEVEASPRQFT
jgi:capsular exopolysaccharide synthesis family protein